MTYKNLRYSHKCSPEPPPVKKQAKPKAKQTPKPKPTSKPPPEIYYSDEEEEVPHPTIDKRKSSHHRVLGHKVPYPNQLIQLDALWLNTITHSSNNNS